MDRGKRHVLPGRGAAVGRLPFSGLGFDLEPALTRARLLRLAPLEPERATPTPPPLFLRPAGWDLHVRLGRATRAP